MSTRQTRRAYELAAFNKCACIQKQCDACFSKVEVARQQAMDSNNRVASLEKALDYTTQELELSTSQESLYSRENKNLGIHLDALQEAYVDHLHAVQVKWAEEVQALKSEIAMRKHREEKLNDALETKSEQWSALKLVNDARKKCEAKLEAVIESKNKQLSGLRLENEKLSVQVKDLSRRRAYESEGEEVQWEGDLAEMLAASASTPAKKTTKKRRIQPTLCSPVSPKGNFRGVKAHPILVEDSGSDTETVYSEHPHVSESSQ